MTTRGFLTMLMLSCNFWGLVIYLLDKRSEGITESIRRISVPPQRENLLIRLHRRSVNATTTHMTGRIRLRTARATLHVEQQRDLVSLPRVSQQGSGPASVKMPFVPPSVQHFTQVQAAKVRLGHTSGSSGFYFTQDIPGSLIAKLEQGINDGGADTIPSSPEHLARYIQEQ